MSTRDYILIAAATTAVLAFVLIILPRLAVRDPDDLQHVTEVKDQISLKNERLKLRNEFRTTVVSFIGGLALIAGVLVTFGQSRSSQEALADSLETSQQQLVVAQGSARDQQYVENVRNLSDANTAVRIAAIEVLADIAANGTYRDVQKVGIIFGAFLRQHAPWPPPPEHAYPADADVTLMPPLSLRIPDVADVMNIRGTVLKEDKFTILSGDLRVADLRGDYSGMTFSGAHLGGSWMSEADLTEAWFEESDLSYADLRDARLCGTHLGTADLTGASLEGAVADSETTWPDHFDHAAAGVQEARGGDCTT